MRGDPVPIRYRIDVIAALKSAGYSTYRIRKESILQEHVLQLIRDNKPISWNNLDKICTLLGCQPGDILESVEDLPQAPPEEHQPDF